MNKLMELVNEVMHHKSMEDSSRDVYYSGYGFKEAMSKIQAIVDDYERTQQKFNKFELQVEDLECAHLHLDDLKVPREEGGGNVYSIVGRINKLSERTQQQRDKAIELLKMYTERFCKPNDFVEAAEELIKECEDK